MDAIAGSMCAECIPYMGLNSLILAAEVRGRDVGGASAVNAR